MKWAGVSIDTSRLKNVDGTTIESRFQTVESAGGGGIHLLIPPISGKYYTNMTTGAGTSTNSRFAHQFDCYFFHPVNTLVTDQFNIKVHQAIANSECQFFIFSNLNGKPSTKLYSSTSVNCSTTGIKTITLNTPFTFEGGTIYWLCVHGNANATNVILEGAIFTTSNMAYWINPTSTSTNPHFNSWSYATYTYGSVPNTIPTNEIAYDSIHSIPIFRFRQV